MLTLAVEVSEEDLQFSDVVVRAIKRTLHDARCVLISQEGILIVDLGLFWAHGNLPPRVQRAIQRNEVGQPQVLPFRFSIPMRFGVPEAPANVVAKSVA